MSAQLRLVNAPTIQEQINLSDVFHRVNRLLPEEQELSIVSPDEPVRDALETMKRKDFSQLPVVENQEVLGVFSYRSLARGLSQIDPARHNLLDVSVVETMDTVTAGSFAQVTHQLGDILDALHRHDAVLVGEPTRLQGIVTTMDVLRYLNLVSGRFLLLEEIELCIRGLLRAVMSEEQIARAADLALKHYAADRKPRCLEDMTFNDYVQIVGHGDLWDQCRHAFSGDRHRTNVKLKRLNVLRNDVFHFRRELTRDDDAELRFGRDWCFVQARRMDARPAGWGQP